MKKKTKLGTDLTLIHTKQGQTSLFHKMGTDLTLIHTKQGQTSLFCPHFSARSVPHSSVRQFGVEDAGFFFAQRTEA